MKIMLTRSSATFVSAKRKKKKNVPHKLRIGPDFNSSDTLDFDETHLNLPSPSSVTRTTLRLVPPKSRARKCPSSLPNRKKSINKKK